MIFNILQFSYFKNNIKHTLLFGSIVYFGLILFLYSNHANKIQYLSQIRKYIIHIILTDLVLCVILNKAEIVDIITKKHIVEPTNKKLENKESESESESESDFDPYHKQPVKKYKEEKIINKYDDISPFKKISDSSSDIDLPIYK